MQNIGVIAVCEVQLLEYLQSDVADDQPCVIVDTNNPAELLANINDQPETLQHLSEKYTPLQSCNFHIL